MRPRFGLWHGRYFVSVCVGGFGVSLGPGLEGKSHDLMPIVFFRNFAYRGWRS